VAKNGINSNIEEMKAYQQRQNGENGGERNGNGGKQRSENQSSASKVAKRKLMALENHSEEAKKNWRSK